MLTSQLYRTWRPNEILQEIHKLEKDMKTLSEWSAQNGLVFNNDNLKYITFSSKRKVNDKSYLIRSNRKSIAEETTIKLLGANFDQNLMWSSHVNSIVNTSYGILRTLKTIKRFTPFKVRKSLAESLVPSRLNYSNAVFGQLTKYLQNRSQLVQKSAACYVICHNYGYVINLNWLPLHESIQYNIVLNHSPLLQLEFMSYIKLRLR